MAWLRATTLTRRLVTREDLASFEFRGRRIRLLGPQTGIWTLSGLSHAAIGISTAYVPDGRKRPYDDEVGTDGFLRYKYRGTDPNHADNRALRAAMEMGLPLVWYQGIAYVPGGQTQLFWPEMPVYLIGEEREFHQFVVAFEQEQRLLTGGESPEARDIARRYNERIAKVRYHQPMFRERVLNAYETRCAVCRLPFADLLDAAHIKPDREGGPARVSNGMALCRIHHGAYDTDILGISPEYRIHIRTEVLETFDGPTLQHSLKEMHGESLRQLPTQRSSRPDRDFLAERFEKFRAAS